MKLDSKINYIVSGLERSGTSLLMQILHAGGMPTAFDDSLRQPDENNPKGYYELAGGKIINQLMEGTFDLEKYRGQFIKITSYGLRFLPPGKYKIIYSERNIKEILDSMEKMTGIKDKSREETRKIFTKLNDLVKSTIIDREDIEVLLVNFNDIMADPETDIKKIHVFLELPDAVLDKMIKVVDKGLYRQRRT